MPQHARDVRKLDEWARDFGFEHYFRHDADSLANAQLLQVVLAGAARSGVPRMYAWVQSQSRAW